MIKVQIDVTGTTPLLMHSDLLADPLHPLTKEFKKLSSKRSKTDEDFESIARMEWEAGLYRDGDTIIMPSSNLSKCFTEGARITKRGRTIERGLTTLSPSFLLDFEGPNDLDALYQDGRFVDRRSVKVGQTRVMRVRPIFRQWSISATYGVETDVLDLDDLQDVANDAGTLVGLGDYRVGGGYGRFEAAVTRL